MEIFSVSTKYEAQNLACHQIFLLSKLCTPGLQSGENIKIACSENKRSILD